MSGPYRRKRPEELLSMAEAEEAWARTGRLKIFLGYASGVGKSFRMFDEARRRHTRGQDVVVGGVQARMPPEVLSLLEKLETIPPKQLGGAPAMNLEAILARHPEVCVVDGLAYDNPPGSRNAARWQDVEEILRAGIAVIGSVNIQYIEELREQVEAITGKHVTPTVPVSFIRQADEIVVVDAPVQNPAGADGDLHIQMCKLTELRSLALVLAAEVVDQQLETYLRGHGIEQHFGTQERIMICVTPRANIAPMLQTGRIIAERFHGEMIVAYVDQPDLSAEGRAALEQKLELARSARAAIEILHGEDIVETLLGFARERGITQVYIGHTQRAGLWARVWGSPVDRLIRQSEGMDIRVFPN